MARSIPLPPSAACLSASMRDLGYSLEAAVADLIDNSISADATAIDIFCEASAAEPILVILDNGHGMDAAELLVAMRHGTVNPREERSPRDLGRFGLGLKTASFSQCRSLTVVSAKDGILSGAEWNLDIIDATDDWILNILEDEDIQALPYVDRLGEHGTAVIWRELDRLLEDESGIRRDEIVNEKLDVLEKHLSLVFHRFLAGEIRGRSRIAVTVNGHPVEPFDPFCRKNTYTRHLPEEIVRIGSAAVHLQPYILPHHSNLTVREYDFYQSRSDFISNQGAYIYRNGRLMAWGDWFRLIPKGEATKLARVQIDFPNSLDEAWTIDIKKSRSRPPLPVRERLRQIIAQVSGASTTVHRGRGQKLFQEVNAPLWERYADQTGIRYALNGSHPLVQRLRDKLDGEGIRHLDLLLEATSASLPVEMVYSDYSTNPREVSQTPSLRDVRDRLDDLRRALWGDASGNAEAFRDIVRSTRLFDDYGEIVESYIQGGFA
jgi:Histidine kinase-, DNA gyrase B-, and HSP90-like ATPase